MAKVALALSVSLGVRLETISVVDAPGATHLSYRVVGR